MNLIPSCLQGPNEKIAIYLITYLEPTYLYLLIPTCLPAHPPACQLSIPKETYIVFVFQMISSESSTITSNPISQQSQGSVQRIRNQMFGRTSRLCAKKTNKKHGWTASFVCPADNHQQKSAYTNRERASEKICGLGI